MTITYIMRNVTPDLVHTVMIRKFFQMVFVGNDRKSLHIYTASVIGGRKEKLAQHLLRPDTDPYQTKCVSQLNDLTSFCMKFGFVVRGNDNNDVLSIENQDITLGGETDFFSQVKYIQQVWGDECEVIYNDQSKLNSRLQKVVKPELITKDTPVTALLAQQKLLYICDEHKVSEGEMTALAIPGSFDSENYIRSEEKPKPSEGSERAFYRIKVPDGPSLVQGIELVNWIKTTIQFKFKFRDSNLNFCLQKEMQPQENTHYLTPDFTWYFSPPVKSFINNESSSVEVKSLTVAGDPPLKQCKYYISSNESAETGRKKSNIPEAHECACPVWKQDAMDHLTKRYTNVINPVANKTTVNFKRWTDDEMIGYRQKYRLSTRNIFTRTAQFDAMRELSIFLDTTDEHGRGNRQFVLSIFISFALAFGIDSTRLSLAKPYFPLQQLLTADAWWLVLLILLSLNLLIRPPHAEREHLYFRWRKINVLTSLGWVLYVFILSKSALLTSLLSGYQNQIYFVIHLLYGLLFISNFWYAFKNIKKYHDPIIGGIFDDDIL